MVAILAHYTVVVYRSEAGHQHARTETAIPIWTQTALGEAEVAVAEHFLTIHRLTELAIHSGSTEAIIQLISEAPSVVEAS